MPQDCQEARLEPEVSLGIMAAMQTHMRVMPMNSRFLRVPMHAVPAHCPPGRRLPALAARGSSAAPDTTRHQYDRALLLRQNIDAMAPRA